MKNKQFIESFEEIGPSEKQKEKMLQNVLNKKNKQFSYLRLNFAMASMCLLCCCMIMNGYFSGSINLEPKQHQPRVFAENQNDFCFQNICYQEIGVTTWEEKFVYLETVYEKDERIKIYQSGEENILILKRENSYFMYQKIEE